MNAEELLFTKIIKRSATWGEIRKEIYRDFMYLTEIQRNEFTDEWEKLTSTRDFHQRKMKNDKSNDPRLYEPVYDYKAEEEIKKNMRAIRKNMRYINGKPVDMEKFKSTLDV